MKRFVIVGLGNFGTGLAETLHKRGHEVIAVDVQEDAVDRIAPYVSRAVVADGQDLEVLRRIGAQDADAGIVSTGDDITASILSSMTLIDLDVREVYVKVISRDHARAMGRIGVTETIFPERQAAVNLGVRLSSSDIFNYVRLGEDVSMQEIIVPEAWEGRSLRDLQLRQRYNCSVVAVHDNLLNQIQVPPEPGAPLKDTDTLLVAGRDEDLEQIPHE